MVTGGNTPARLVRMMVSEKTYLMPVVLLGAIEGRWEAGLVAFGGCSAHGS